MVLSARYRKKFEPITSGVARFFTWLHPNIITYFSILVAIASAYAFSQKLWIWGGLLGLFAGALDSLDGSVARRTGRTSKWGAYLDAIVDRYVEGIILFGIAWGAWMWPPVYFMLLGSLLISYAKARAAMETKVDNINWPDLFERAERLILVCVGVPIAEYTGFLFAYLWILAIAFHLGAIQRILRVRRMLHGSVRRGKK